MMEFLCLLLVLPLVVPFSQILFCVETFALIVRFLVDIAFLAVVTEIVILGLNVRVLVHHGVFSSRVSDAVASRSKLLPIL